MEIWIPVNIQPIQVREEIQKWLDKYSYHAYNDGQWLDYSGGLIFGYNITKQLGVFLEGKYNKYWNREWHDFSVGVNYVIR